MFEETITGITRREASVRGIGRLDKTIGWERLHDIKTGMKFFQIKEPKGEIWTEEYYNATVYTCFTQMGEKRCIKTYEKREVVAILNEYKIFTTLVFLGPKTQQ